MLGIFFKLTRKCQTKLVISCLVSGPSLGKPVNYRTLGLDTITPLTLEKSERGKLVQLDIFIVELLI